MAGYLPAAAAERAAQYAALGLSGPEALYRDVPESVRLTAPLNLPPPQSELEARRTLEALAEQNLRFRTILRGAGAYDHYIPAAVSRIASQGGVRHGPIAPLSGGDQPGGAPVHLRVPDHDL